MSGAQAPSTIRDFEPFPSRWFAPGWPIAGLQPPPYVVNEPGSAWNVRRMLRRFVLSSTFRQESSATKARRDLTLDEARGIMVLAQGAGDRAVVRYFNDRAAIVNTATLQPIAAITDGRNRQCTSRSMSRPKPPSERGPMPTVEVTETSAGTFGPPCAATAFIAPMKQAA